MVTWCHHAVCKSGRYHGSTVFGGWWAFQWIVLQWDVTLCSRYGACMSVKSCFVCVCWMVLGVVSQVVGFLSLRFWLQSGRYLGKLGYIWYYRYAWLELISGSVLVFGEFLMGFGVLDMLDLSYFVLLLPTLVLSFCKTKLNASQKWCFTLVSWPRGTRVLKVYMAMHHGSKEGICLNKSH